MSAPELVGGRFRLDSRVGAGGMGVVYRARDEQTGRAVALKILDGRAAHDVERATREAAVLAGLAHPAIVGHVANGVLPDGRAFLAMEWIDGQTVAQRLGGDGFTLRETIALTRRIASALVAAHSSGILHRDIKPSNVLLRGNAAEAATLIDFGLARATDTVTSLTRTGATIGTPGYMAPEQARGERTLGPTADMFGLGCLVYECGTGRPAFSGTVCAAVLAKILFATPAPFEELCPEAPHELAALVATMLHKDASTRTPDATHVLAVLDALGEVPDGPRRTAKHLIAEPTIRASVVQQHCVVIATRGALDDMLEPPSDEQLRELRRSLLAYSATIEVLATGAVIAHLAGDPDEVLERAASCSLAMQEVLPGWTIALSSPARDADSAVETGTAFASSAVMVSIFQPGGAGVSIDRGAAARLERGFELDRSSRVPKLVRKLIP